jgi:DNA-binding transcriptional ArsR family regulator
MNKLETFAVNHETLVFYIVAFFPFFAVFTPAILFEEFWQYLSYIYILILVSIPGRRSVLIGKINQKIDEFLDKDKRNLSNDLGEERYKELTDLSNDLEDAKKLYSRKLISGLNSSVIVGLVLTLFSAFYNF